MFPSRPPPRYVVALEQALHASHVAVPNQLLAVSAPVGAGDRVPFSDVGLGPSDFARLVIQMPTATGHTGGVTVVPTAGSSTAVHWDALFHPNFDYSGGGEGSNDRESLMGCASSHMEVVGHHLGTPVVSTPPTAAHRVALVLTLPLAVPGPRPLPLPPVTPERLPAALATEAAEWAADRAGPPWVAMKLQGRYPRDALRLEALNAYDRRLVKALVGATVSSVGKGGGAGEGRAATHERRRPAAAGCAARGGGDHHRYRDGLRDRLGGRHRINVNASANSARMTAMGATRGTPPRSVNTA